MGVLYLKNSLLPLFPFLTSAFLTFFSLYSVLYRLNFFHSHFVTVILYAILLLSFSIIVSYLEISDL